MQTIIDEYHALFSRFIADISQGLANAKTINQRDIGTVFAISRQDISLARMRNDISPRYSVAAKFDVTIYHGEPCFNDLS